MCAGARCQRSLALRHPAMVPSLTPVALHPAARYVTAPGKLRALSQHAVAGGTSPAAVPPPPPTRWRVFTEITKLRLSIMNGMAASGMFAMLLPFDVLNNAAVFVGATLMVRVWGLSGAVCSANVRFFASISQGAFSVSVHGFAGGILAGHEPGGRGRT